MVNGGELEQPLLPATPKESSYATAGFFSLITLSWVNPVLKLGRRRTLELTDLPTLSEELHASNSYSVLQSNWQGTVLKSITKSFWKHVILNMFIFLLYETCQYIGAYLIRDLVDYLAGAQHYLHEGPVLVGIFLAITMLGTFSLRQLNIGIEVTVLRVWSSLQGVLYRKGLSLSSLSRRSHTSGEIVNFMTLDVQRVTMLAVYLTGITIPVQIVVALLILYYNVGAAAFAALAATAITILVNIPLTRLQRKYQTHIMQAKDERMRASTECLTSMKVLKLQAWEKAFLDKLQKLRGVEYGWLKWSFLVRAGMTYVFWTGPVIIGIATFGTCVFLNIPLTAGRVLSTLATFNLLQTPLNLLPQMISVFTQAWVSLQRLDKFLNLEELKDDVVKVGCSDDTAVVVESGNFSWDGTSDNLTLRSINFMVKKGTTVAVCGTVGSGKSSLLSCLLGEIPKIAGQVIMSGMTAYVAQSAWIQTDTIQDNILFGTSMDQAKYMKVLKVCQLQKDLELLPHGDKTIIGERGINLSGGQKQRVQLARALYQDADVYLLDDPLSALDAETGSKVFKEYVLGALSSKTVVLVTHQVQFLPMVDLVLVLKDGHITESGSYRELMEHGTDIMTLISAHDKAVNIMEESSKLATPSNEEVHEDDVESAEKPEPEQSAQVIKDEEREKGSVGFDVYWAYLTACFKGMVVPAIISAQIIFQVLLIAGNWWMARETPVDSTQTSTTSSVKLITVYTVLTLGGSIFVVIRVILVAMVGLATAQKFFLRMINSIFHAPMSFFDSTPSGRILTRASTDQTALDLDIPYQLSDVSVAIIKLICIALVMSRAAWPILFIFLPVLSISFELQRYYISSGRELSRIVGVQGAPVLHRFAEMLAGVSTIRGFHQQERFLHNNFGLVDNSRRPRFYSTAASEWVTLYLEIISMLVFSLCLILVFNFPSSAISPGLAGLAVTYGLELSSALGFLIYSLNTVENRMVSLERIQQYCGIASEAPWEIKDAEPSKDWPSKGKIEIENVQVRYNVDSPLVLHGISCIFPGGSKVGVVGRTGSGKSTLAQAIFRMVELAGGKIVIDGVDISQIGLHQLRSKLSIIPQEPVLFEGTVRYNLDPLGNHSDEDIWQVLDKCQLGEVVRSKIDKLDSTVANNGENWSAGQRQLFCLGRVMLKRSRILLLDEATASVDTATDALIQSMLCSEFVECSVITIAHRLHTVVNSDLVLVLNEGRIREYDQPSKLLQIPSSRFSKMAQRDL